MSTLTLEFAEILASIKRPGSFFAAGATEFYAPELEVSGIGSIALPLLPIQAKQLIALAERAPYGRGEDTVLDTTVRRTWQIAPEQLNITGRNWPHTLDTVITHCTQGLGVKTPVSAELYKLLIYDEGSFFIEHRDTEKAPGMFATLIIVLPSLHQGGELLVRHRDQQVRLDLSDAEPSEVSFAAFYADCVHEILPITSGYRLALIYNLRHDSKSRRPQLQPPDYATEQLQLAAQLHHWIAALSQAQHDEPEKLIYPLEHAYTSAELSFRALKGADAARASVLLEAAQQMDCDLHLALLTIEESGAAEYTGYSSWRDRRYNPDEYEQDDDFEIYEVIDRDQRLSDWRGPNDEPSTWGTLPFLDQELSPAHSVDDLEPDEQYFHEATGNEGASFERTYRRAALVIWPRKRRLAVLNQAGLSATLPYLSDLAQQWAEQKTDTAAPLWQQAHELAAYMLSTWSVQEAHPHRLRSERNAQMLTALAQLQDSEAITTFLTTVSAAGDYGKEENTAIVATLSLLPLPQAVDFCQRIIMANAFTSLGSCAELLLLCSKSTPFSQQKPALSDAAQALIKALPGDPQQASHISSWRRSKADSDSLIKLFSALENIDPALATQAADHIKQWPEAYDPDKILIPAVLALQENGLMTAAVQALRAVCLQHLHTRTAQALAPPGDWTRNAKLRCDCSDCQQLSQFLADAEQANWAFKAVGDRRDHVESTIQQSRCDVDTQTDKKGRPYQLICTKNQASYERRARQREQDLGHLAQLQSESA